MALVKSIQCTACAVLNPITAKFCNNCGTKFVTNHHPSNEIESLGYILPSYNALNGNYNNIACASAPTEDYSITINNENEIEGEGEIFIKQSKMNNYPGNLVKNEIKEKKEEEMIHLCYICKKVNKDTQGINACYHCKQYICSDHSSKSGNSCQECKKSHTQYIVNSACMICV